MVAITSAGAGSGIDMESIISASVSAKRSQLQQPVVKQQVAAQTTLSGVGQLKSAISTFTSVLDDLSAAGAFNKRNVTITQSTDDPILKVETKTGASNGQYNITVNKLAKTSRQEGIFDSSTTALATTDGQLTFSAGGKQFTVDVKAGDTLQNIRKSINASGDNFGLSANIINTSDGKAKLVIDSGVSGDGKDLSITSSNSELNIFATGAVGTKMAQTQAASSAEIDVDGNTLKSDTNIFDDSVQDLKITLLRTSDKDTSGNFLSNKVDISTDKTAIQSMVQKFINGYNTLIDSSNALGKRNSMVAGVNQNDGGELAGDSTPRIITNFLSSSVSAASTLSTSFSTIFEVGVKMDNKGKLSLDSTKFSDALDKNYDQVVALFGDSTGVAGSMSTGLKEYTKTGGLLSQRQDSLNTSLRTIAQKESDITAQVTKYEASLRKTYGNLDALVTKMNKSASSLSALTSSS
ncbi:flagellar filament capping protein FliD [uncultured Tolumonas sp.]|uniref:flagellar filament capping protein FliD n=1 Tax=uncultured Tolumonas sp. TaxID=263765 RepID=UPI002931C19E|nr:flagellar filament capping protein FliD [uncultured Tolumonas sp.]